MLSELDGAIAEVERRYVARNPQSLARFKSASAVMPGGNTRTTLHYDPFPVTLVRGEGARLTDLDGHEYVDFLGDYTAGLYGHSSPEILAAVRQALEDGFVLGGPNPYEARLAELMCRRFPGLEMVRFCNSGTEANLMNLCLARAVTGRPAILTFEGGYHGGSLAFKDGGSPLNAPFDAVIGRYNDPEGARELIRRNAARLAAVIVEPMLGSGGCIEGSPEFLAVLREETEREGIVLMFDEVMTSRLAPGGLHEATGITPDLLSFGKYLGGGMSFGAFGGRADLMAKLDPSTPGAWAHSGTFNNNVLGMAAGIAGLERVYTPEAVAALNAAGDRLRREFQRRADNLQAPLTVTGRGSLMCIHFRPGPITSPAEAAAVSPGLRKLFHLSMLLAGFYLARRGFIALSLPLAQRERDDVLKAFDRFLSENQAIIATARDVAPSGGLLPD